MSLVGQVNLSVSQLYHTKIKETVYLLDIVVALNGITHVKLIENPGHVNKYSIKDRWI